MAMFSARGLNNFISEIRACTSREDEQKRIDKELAKIRQKFSQSTQLHSYDKKKYAWKLIYIYMLGYEIDFGHMQVINLVSSAKYSEKCLGYLGTSILLRSSDELMTLVVNSIRNDLKSTDAAHQCLALCCVANLGGNEYSEALSPDVVSLLLSSASIAHVRKKAALCTRRMMLANPDLIPLDVLEPKLRTMMAETHLGVVTSTASLVQTALQQHGTSALPSLAEVCIVRLSSLVVHKACPRDYMYYNVPCPWLQVKLLRILQQLGPLDDANLMEKLNDTLRRILSRPIPGKGAKNNAMYAVLIETVNLVISQGKRSEPKLKEMAIQLLARFISVSEPNIRYIGLDSMYRLVRLEGHADDIKQHKSTVLFSLKDADNSVRRRALDLLFSMCDSENALEIVGELLNYLAIAEDASIREEIVLKAAILAEKYAKNLQWYVDTVLQLITIAGSQVPDDVWHRVVQIVTNKEDLQKYAAEVMFRALEPKHVDETTMKFGAYVLGEFGYLISGSHDMSATRQFEVLHRHYVQASTPTKCLILTAFVKMENLYDEIQPRVLEVFKRCATNMNLEIQQRACEYLSLHQVDGEIMKRVLDPMPVFPENRESALIVRLRNQQKAANGEDAEAVPRRMHDQDENDNDDSDEAQNPADEGDLLSLDSPPKPSSKSSADSNGPYAMEAVRTPDLVGHVNRFDAELEPRIAQWFKHVLCNPQGVLFENQMLQIGVKHEYRGSQGRVQLFFGNKASESLEQFKVQVNGGSMLRSQVENVPAVIAPKQQVKQQVLVEAMAPIVHAPSLVVSFRVHGCAYEYPLQLPCHVTSFLEPVPLGADDFMKRWHALEGHDREQQEVFQTSDKMDMAATRSKLTEKLNFAQAQNVDTTEASITLAATYRTGSLAPSGDKISVGCLARVEGNTATNSYRVAIRAVHKDVSSGLKNALRSILQ